MTTNLGKLSFVRLHSVLLLELQILLPESVDGVNHDLDQLDLGVSQPVLVGDIVGNTCTI